MRIILASASPRRKELLTRMGLTDFSVVTSDADETLQDGLSPAEQVERLSLLKARSAAKLVPEDALIIAADTVVTLNSAILGKPSDENDAFSMLSALSGSRHQVYTGVTVLHQGKNLTCHEMTSVDFRPLSSEEIRHYIATKECMDKAGAYGIQGYGCLLVEGIVGDYYNVMGLPVVRLARMLGEFGIDCLKYAAKEYQP